MLRNGGHTVNTAPRMLFLGSYPPRECGIATFTKDVVDSFDARFGSQSGVIAIDEPGGESRAYPASVVARLEQNDRASYARIADFINADACDALSIQHEYGLHGGEDGEWIVDLIERVRKPVIVSLHTVLPDPSDHHFTVARMICERASAVVVLSETGRDILIDRYGITPSKIWVIHHGVPDVPFRETGAAKAAMGIGHRTVISTFGLINRGKGLEYAIQAMRPIADRHPETMYYILGQTHPVIRRREGEEYRESLQAMVENLGLGDNVKLIDRYLTIDEIIEWLAATDVYLTPYLNPVQIVSGTLAYAMGSGKAIVSTRYLYAEELLAHGRGFLVDFRDAHGIARTMTALLDDPGLRASTERRAYRFGRQMTWPHVADEYGRLFTSLVPTRPAVVLVPA
jgi:glycosyltransferase involved in cell wall biosynthesis